MYHVLPVLDKSSRLCGWAVLLSASQPEVRERREMAQSTEHSALRERLQQKEVEVTALTSLIHKQGRSLHNFSQSLVDDRDPDA